MAILTSRPVREAGELARTTPGVLTALALVVVAASLLAGMFTSLSVQGRGQAIDDLATRSGPLAAAAGEIYRSLSDADATASGAFLTGGLEPTATRRRYEADVAQASNALAIAIAAREPGDITAAGSPLATLSQQLPVYTGLVETARADNRQGLPLGAAYQREASNLMSTTLLPAAQALYRGEADRLAADQDRAGSAPWVEVLLALVVLALLVVAQVVLRRRTNRVFNAGLLIATAAAVVSLAWVLIATVAAMSATSASRTNGSAQVDVLVQARIATLKARADETLTLVARGVGGAYQDDYAAVTRQLAGLLDRAKPLATDTEVSRRVEAASADARAWATAHAGIRAADDQGDYVTAVRLATDAGPTGAAGIFDRLDGDLRDAIDRARDTFGTEVNAASRDLAGAVAATTVLAVLVAAGSAAGIWRRLRDYR
ncbi:hypothetical protein [Amycolatopsis alkalitolerans]|uniref:Secreted protein n=1 Tax=Amycolatopsis alkalitolerans TaxID=2547244 RepID=A0A5C4LP07_9PSEU|nr:hypothetical protein [Amycolatopsis alkalitolerans]TNC18816.1 hypothetical protein FG385_33405 [Amycolatopsis alkalitolerans]